MSISEHLPDGSFGPIHIDFKSDTIDLLTIIPTKDDANTWLSAQAREAQRLEASIRGLCEGSKATARLNDTTEKKFLTGFVYHNVGVLVTSDSDVDLLVDHVLAALRIPDKQIAVGPCNMLTDSDRKNDDK